MFFRGLRDSAWLKPEAQSIDQMCHAHSVERVLVSADEDGDDDDGDDS